MTNDPYEICIFIIILTGFPLFVWVIGRVAELMVAGEEDRLPKFLTVFVNRKQVEDAQAGKIKQANWRLMALFIGSLIPAVMICSAKEGHLLPRLMVILASIVVFLLAVALLEWLVRPRSR